MAFPYAPGPSSEGPPGDTYAVLLLRTALDRAVEELRRIHFSGWIAPPESGWLPVLAVPGDGAVAAGRRGIVDVGAELAATLDTPAVAIRVLADRQLALVAWSGGEELGRYVSDPSREPGAEEDTLPDPYGVSLAPELAELCGHADRAADISDLLDEPLDPDSFIESERLAKLLRLLSLPTWLVAVATLPRDIPTGPGAAELTHLGPPRWLARRTRRRAPAPVLTDPPRGASGMDPWLL
ncbi:hypothetical protein JIG36_10295 [Actinoplanes sp. LDG1-06]|uniref:Uncharacterized protein n=1 Tax=Paractinoplanes ovalisporus TaxID=2810368 RepID=A0ABS2A7Y5_9ACTN|nr:hypothetical protein [Actinoplanes ovalisporus]MBM2615946.1 hypothetical protein [Actinoplanes ovalisporus]